MSETFGSFISAGERQNIREYLDLSFSPSSVPLKQRWRNNGLSADFMADYVSTFIPKDENDPATVVRQAEIKSAVGYIANELLENAMKFNDEKSNQPISIRLLLEQDGISFFESNGVSQEKAAIFKAFIQKIMSSDPGELYLSQLEENAVTDSTSGLGYLTMINDYGAELAWKFDQDGQGMTVTTQVRIVF